MKRFRWIAVDVSGNGAGLANTQTAMRQMRWELCADEILRLEGMNLGAPLNSAIQADQADKAA